MPSCLHQGTNGRGNNLKNKKQQQKPSYMHFQVDKQNACLFGRLKAKQHCLDDKRTNQRILLLQPAVAQQLQHPLSLS